MKLNLKPSKPKTVLAKSAKEKKKELQVFADTSGKYYEDMRQEIEGIEKKKKETADVIKERASKEGIHRGAEYLIEGKEFLVGFQMRSPISLDIEIAKKILRKDVLKKILTVIPEHEQINAGTFEKLVDSGEISAMAAKQIINRGKTVKAIVVRKINATPKTA